MEALWRSVIATPYRLSDPHLNAFVDTFLYIVIIYRCLVIGLKECPFSGGQPKLSYMPLQGTDHIT